MIQLCGRLIWPRLCLRLGSKFHRPNLAMAGHEGALCFFFQTQKGRVKTRLPSLPEKLQSRLQLAVNDRLGAKWKSSRHK